MAVATSLVLQIVQGQVVFLLCLCTLIGYLFIQHHKLALRRRAHGANPPAVQKLPLGVDLLFEVISVFTSHDLVAWTQKILHVPGRTVELNILGSRMILTDSPENIKAMMSTQFSEFGHGKDMHECFKNVLGDSIFATDGDLWQENKKKLRPHVTKIRPTDSGKIEKHISHLLSKIISSNGSTVDVYDLIDRYQLDTVTDIFLGQSAGSLHQEHHPFRDSMETLLKINSLRVILGPLGLLLSDKFLAGRSLQQLDGYLETHVQRAMSMSIEDLQMKADKDRTLMDAMALEGLDAQGIKNQLTAVLLAAKDPVAILLSWAIYELAQNPKVFQKVKEEINQHCNFDNEPSPSVQQINEMVYLNNVIKETMRLYHPVGLNVREARVDTSLPFGGGKDGQQPIGLLAGDSVAYSILGLQRRKDLIGPDAETFKPERWENWSPGLWEFIPFNHGPRICLGRAFGQFQMAYTLIRIVQRSSKITLAEQSRGEQRFTVEMNTKMACPIICRFWD